MLIRMTLQKKIVLIAILGLLVVIVAFGSVSIWALRESTERSLEERLLLAKVTAEHLDLHHKETLEQLREIAASALILVEGDNPEIEEKARESIHISPRVFTGGSFILDKDGRVVWNGPDEGALIGSEMSNYPLVEETYQTGQAGISGVIFDSASGTPLILYTVPIIGENGLVAGVTGGAIDLSTPVISEFIETIKLGETGYAQVVDERGVLVASTKPEKVFGKGDHGDRFVALIQDKKAVVRACHNCHEDVEGTERRKDVLAFAPLSMASWGVAIRQSEQEALAPTRHLERNLLLVGVIALALASVLTVILARRIIRPVKMLTVAAQGIATGDLASPVPPMGEDEIGRLAQAFDSMRVNLKRSRESLLQRNTELEILNSMADSLSRQLAPELVLHTSLDRLLELTRLSVAWVCTRDPHDRPVLAAHRSVCVRDEVDTEDIAAECGCRDVFGTGQGKVFSSAPGCPLVADGSGEREGLHSYAVVPLWSRDGVVGVLAVASQEVAAFDRSRMQLLTSIGQQMGIALENARLYAELQRKERIREALLDKLISTQEEERRRIAREIHDEPTQALTGVILQLDQVASQLASQKGGAPQGVESVRQGVRVAMESLHQITTELRPQALDDLGFVPAIRRYADQRLGSRGIQVDFEVVGQLARLPAPIEVAVFRITQEAISNVAKHAEAATVYIQLRLSHAAIRGKIVDDGKGFELADASTMPTEEVGLGLLGMQERAILLGGSFSISSSPGQGTEISFDIPLR